MVAISLTSPSNVVIFYVTYNFRLDRLRSSSNLNSSDVYWFPTRADVSWSSVYESSPLFTTPYYIDRFAASYAAYNVDLGIDSLPTDAASALWVTAACAFILNSCYVFTISVTSFVSDSSKRKYYAFVDTSNNLLVTKYLSKCSYYFIAASKIA